MPSYWTHWEGFLVSLYQACEDRLGSIGRLETGMTERIATKAFVHQLTLRMQTDDQVAAAWLEGTLETLYDTFKAGKGVTLTGFGGFYVQPKGKSWAFKCNPGQKLRALFGWSSSYTYCISRCNLRGGMHLRVR
jgi:nucleoid DNA-binding protein